MSKTRQEFEALRLAEQKRSKKFEQALAFIRSEGATGWKYNNNILISCLIELGNSIFPTPQERLKYALPSVLTFLRENLGHSERSCAFDVLKEWGLEGNKVAARKVLNYVAGSGRCDLSYFSNLAKKYLPEGERNIVFEKALNHTGFLIPFSGYTERAQRLADVAKEYVPQDKWPIAYALFKQSLLHTLTGEDKFGNKKLITNEGIEKVATMLSVFATHLPLSERMKAQACEDVLGLLDHPTQYVGGREVVAAYYSSQSGLIRFEAKKNLTHALLCAEDYPPVLEDLSNRHRGDFAKDAALLREAAKYCLPAETQNETLLTDLLDMATSAFGKKESYPNLRDFSNVLADNLGIIYLSSEQKEVVVRWVEHFAKQLSLKGCVDDDDILSAFTDVSHKLLTGKEILSWLEKLVEEPFLKPLSPEDKNNFPFLDFLRDRFKAVANGNQSTHLSAGNVAAGYVQGRLTLAFAAATVIDPSRDQGVVILDFKGAFTPAAEMRERVGQISSVPYIRRAHLERYDGLVDLVAK